ncbi:S-methyl-5-thioribose kinase [Ferrovibrio xuzhouensis]|uniref:S-methyl-5-thioribose kinase n=1 Tax=Ferrovibrio xuzhouensis TaxID=1576914 RepID=A0ABV7VK24_9PROT
MMPFDTAETCASARQAFGGGAYHRQTPATLPDLLATLPEIAGHLGGDPSDWLIAEISDGNMNLVFAASGPNGSVVVKQALPYIRVIGESWPFPLERVRFEHETLQIYARLVPGRTPRVLHYDPELAIIVMEHLTPHLVLRQGLVEGRVFPLLADHIGSFLARTLFFTSDLFLSTRGKRQLMARFEGNEELCATTEEVIFRGPYAAVSLNRWTTPHLDAAVAAMRADHELKLAATELKLVLRTSTEALIHGDLHTGSLMVSEADTRIIDSEWARYGPMGFDLGAVFGNLLLAYFSQPGHATSYNDRTSYQEWLLATMQEIWETFETELRYLVMEHGGELFPSALFEQPSMAASLINSRLRAILSDTIGFAGAKMIRRIIGISHVEDMETIRDPSVRAQCEAKALAVARSMMIQRHAYRDIHALAAGARSASTGNAI